MEYKDYYKILGVAKTASEKEIKAAYRKLARKHHPDVNQGNAKAEARFKEIGEAYEVLSDREKRRRYDQLGANWDAFRGTGTGARTPWPEGFRVVETEGFGGQGFGQNFKPALADLVVARLAPITARMRGYLADPAQIDRVLAEGAEKARAIAEPVLAETKKIVGFWPG